jgi:Arc/MetJ-type ribon-helix-helix transcriptional regulator
MTNITLRLPRELIERVSDVARRDYGKSSETYRRLLRLGLEADERRERVDAAREVLP